MKLHRVQTVQRFDVTLEPEEAELLLAHPKWKHRVGNPKPPQTTRDATLTKKELNAVCDVLGVNGREWLAAALSRKVKR